MLPRGHTGTHRAQWLAVRPRRRIAGAEAVAGALLRDASARHLFGGAPRRYSPLTGDREDTAHGLGDLGGASPGAVTVVADELLGEVDDPACVHDEVRRIQDSPRCERVVVGRLGELIVGAAPPPPPFPPRGCLLVGPGSARPRAPRVRRPPQRALHP